MSLTDRHSSVMIHAGTYTTPTMVDEEATLSEEGWDTLLQKYALTEALYTAEECAADFPQGAQIGTRKWWIVAARPVLVAPGFYLIEVTCKGWAGTKPAKVRVGAAGESQNGTNVVAPEPSPGTGTVTAASFQTVENTPTVAVTYLAEDLDTTANTESVGREFSLPAGVTVAVAASVWDSLSNPTYHWPNGWVLMGSEQDRIPGTDVALVTDNYRYIRPYTPGGS